MVDNQNTELMRINDEEATDTRARSVRKIQKEILSELKMGMDMTDGSFVSCFAGAIATQIASLERTVQSVKLQSNGIFCDAESLILLGRRIGLFIMEGTSSIISFSIVNANLLVGDNISIGDVQWEYTITKIEPGVYYAESKEKGILTNSIPPEWFDDVTIIKHGEQVIYHGQIKSLVKPGTDKEDIAHYRTRVYYGYYTRPFATNPAWFRAFLIQGDYGIGCVRLKAVSYLTEATAATVKVYVGDLDFAPVSSYILDKCANDLKEIMPVGILCDVGSVTLLTDKNRLSYNITVTDDGGVGFDTKFMRQQIRENIESEIHRLVTSSNPIDRLVINMSAMRSIIIDNPILQSHIYDFTITYNYNIYQIECEFPIDVIPGVEIEQITITTANNETLYDESYIPDT